MLYSLNGNYPTPLPNRIRLTNGLTRTDRSTFTAEEISNAGYVAVNDCPVVDNSQVVYWSTEQINWVVRDKTQEELQEEIQSKWKEIREIRDKKLSELDWRVIRHASEIRLGLTPTDDINLLDVYAQALRDITKQENPYEITWPSEQ